MTRLACLLASAVLLLGGCSLLPGGDDDPSAGPDGPTALPATAWKQAAPSRVRAGGTLRLAIDTMPANFNPVQADGTSPDVARVLGPTQGSPIHVTADGGWTVDPHYARSVKVVDENPLTVRVQLNRKAVWQDGSSITAKDMVAFQRAMSGEVDGLEVGSTDGYDDIDAVEPGDDDFEYTVTFDHLRSDWPLYVYPRLAANVSRSPKLFNDGYRRRAVSSNGPFVVSAVDATTGTITETPNPRWWGAKPRLSKIVWRIAEPDVQAKAFAAGELDAVSVDSTTYREAVGHGTVQRASGSQWTHLTLNGGRGPLRDVDVRRAVVKALDRPTAAEATGAAVGAPGRTLRSLLLVPRQRGYRDHPVPGPDRDGALALLTKAGYEQRDAKAVKDGKPLTLTLPVPSGTPTIAARARRIAADLAEVGITVRTPSVDAATFFSSTVVPLDFDLVTFTWSGSPFPVEAAEGRFRPVDSPQNYTGVTPRSLDPLWDAASEQLDPGRRADRIKKLDDRLVDAAVIVPLAVVPDVVVIRPGLVNYGASTFEQPDYTRVGFVTTK